MRCFYCSTLSTGRIELSGQEERHIFSVNRLKLGEKLLFIDGKGLVAQAELLKEKNFKILEMAKQSEPKIKLHLFFAPPRKQQLDQIIEQSPEVSIWSINPIITQRSVSLPYKKADDSRWITKMIESCKQSQNPYVPKINQVHLLNEAIKEVHELNFISFFGSTEPNCNKLDKEIESSNVALFIGPEGGFSPCEIEFMKNNNFIPLNLGSAVMRVETAAIVGSAYLLNALSLK